MRRPTSAIILPVALLGLVVGGAACRPKSNGDAGSTRSTTPASVDSGIYRRRYRQAVFGETLAIEAVRGTRMLRFRVLATGPAPAFGETTPRVFLALSAGTEDVVPLGPDRPTERTMAIGERFVGVLVPAIQFPTTEPGALELFKAVDAGQPAPPPRLPHHFELLNPLPVGVQARLSLDHWPATPPGRSVQDLPIAPHCFTCHDTALAPNCPSLTCASKESRP